MMVIQNKFEIGAIVYLTTDTEQNPRIVTSIIVNKWDLIYELSCGTVSSRHYDFEISDTKECVM